MNIKRMHIVLHTHWDREWYLSFAKQRYRLVKLIDSLIEILIKEFVKEGRLIIGPWYCFDLLPIHDCVNL